MAETSPMMVTFATVALVLAAIGTYGVMSVAVNERVREIGIRMALRAQRRDIERLIVRPGLALAAGIVSAVILARLMSAVLFAVAPTDAVTYGSRTTPEPGGLLMDRAISRCR